MELEDYKPKVGFKVDNFKSLIDFDAMDSKELWLIQCPLDESVNDPKFDGKELKVKLDKDGKFGGIEDSSGKEFELVNHASQDSEATVILPSGEESKFVGNISRFVSFVRRSEPEELTERRKKTLNQAAESEKSSCVTQNKSRRTETKGFKHSSATRSDREKSGITGDTMKTPSRSSKRKHSEHSDRSGKSMLTVSGSSDRSGKSKKKIKHEK